MDDLLKIHGFDKSFIYDLIISLLSKRATSNNIDYNQISLIEYGLKLLFENKKISSKRLEDIKISEISILIDKIDKLRVLKESQVQKLVLEGKELPQYSVGKDKAFAQPAR